MMSGVRSQAQTYRPAVVLLEAILWHVLFVRIISPCLFYYITYFISNKETQRLKPKIQKHKEKNPKRLYSHSTTSTSSRTRRSSGQTQGQETSCDVDSDNQIDMDSKEGKMQSLNKLSYKNLLLMPTYITGIFHATALVFLGGMMYLALRKGNYENEDLIYGRLDLAIYSAEMFSAYILQDLAYLLYYDDILKEREAIVHHLVYLFITIYAAENSYLVFPFTWLCLGEASTPFVSIRWILAVLDLKSSPVYVVNGFVLMFTFFITRIVIYGYGLYHLTTMASYWLYPVGPLGLNLVFFGLFLMYGLNMMWFRRILKGAIKTLQVSNGSLLETSKGDYRPLNKADMGSVSKSTEILRKSWKSEQIHGGNGHVHIEKDVYRRSSSGL